MTVETEPIHHATSTEGERVARFIDDANERVGSWDSCQSVLRTVAAMHEVRQISLETMEVSEATDNNAKIQSYHDENNPSTTC